MRGVRYGAGRGDVLRLFEGESVAGLDEGELLDRFATRRDEAAFEALVSRLGPMVLGVCRRMLADPHDVDDAFQATFLVLVKKASSIRDRDLVAPWLHGVALKVARRARLDAARRRARERVAVEPEAVEDGAGVESGWLELRALIDEEIGRLPETHRRAVVLCDVEGLSREEAALRLGWTLNMVRGRLERARGRLRNRLSRRGVAPSGAWAALVVAPPIPSTALVAITTRAALAFSVGRMGDGLATASAVALSQGVLRMMMVSKLKIGLAALLSAGFVVGSSALIAAQSPGDTQTVKTADAPKPAIAADPFRPRSAGDLAKALVEAALQRYQAQRTFYEAGRTTVDRLIDASRGLMQAETNAAVGKAANVAAARSHYDRLAEILKREQAELEVGRATVADLTEIKSALLEAEFTMAKTLDAPEAKPVVDAARPGPARAPTPLAEAIASFNADASKRDFALEQDPLTEAEVIAAIRYWQPDRELVYAIKGSSTSPPDLPIDAFKAIAMTRRLPEGASFELEALPRDLGGEYIYFGLWVDLSMPRKGGGGLHRFPIRERLSRSITLEEAYKEATDDLRRFSNEPDRGLTARIKNLKERIGERTKDAVPKR